MIVGLRTALMLGIASIAVLAVARSDARETGRAEAPGDVDAAMIKGRAMQAVIWGMPAVNFELLYDSLVKSKGDWNQVVYWSRLPGWKNQTLTPNPDVIYLFPFYDTRKGPVVLEIPAADGGSITGSVDDAWQTAIEDVGPAGVDKGKGAKYLILPPGYKERLPDGYLPMPSSTFTGYGVLRSNIGKGTAEDIAKAVAYGKRVKIYPLSEAPNPKPTKFVDALDVEYTNIIPYDIRFFEALNAFVQREPWLERDRAMIDMLRSIGIEKGRNFAPDQGTKALLQQAIVDAHTWLDKRYDEGFEPFYPGSNWALPASKQVVEAMASNFSRTDNYPVDGRGLSYSFVYFSTKHIGEGQYYLMTAKDKNGAPLAGNETYRLHVPANVPVKLYWSATVYDRATHAFIREQSRFSRASNSQGIKPNPDGSIDIFLGPKAPAGMEPNWIPTVSDGRFEVLFRFYGPDKSFFQKSWTLPDIEKVSPD